MSKIVVSYRRSDSQAISGRIVDRLIAHFGDTSVFMDIENIPFGIDFRQHIKSALSQADMLLAVVGPDWLALGTSGRSRLQDDSDPVRVEIETALAEKLHIIPILIGGAAMPKASELPDSLKDFSFLNAAPVDAGRDFNSHIGRLIQSIDEALSQKPIRSPSAQSRALPISPLRNSKPAVPLGAIAAVLLVIAGAAAWQIASMLTQRPAPAPAAAVALAPKQTSPEAAAAAASVPSGDDLQWDIVKNTSDIGVLKRFIKLNPDSKHRLDAEQRIASLETPSPPVVVPPNSSPPPPASANEHTPPAAPVSASPRDPAISTPPTATVSAGRFDGLWVTTIACDKKGDVQAWSRQCIGSVKASVFHCEWGTAGQPGYNQFDGTIAADGSIDLIQKGLTVDASYSLVRRSGAKFAFPWSGRFDDSRGKATRVEGRTCRMDLVKQ